MTGTVGAPGHASLVADLHRLDDAARERLVSNISGHLLDGVSRPVLERAPQYWRDVDKDLGDRVAKKVNGG